MTRHLASCKQRFLSAPTEPTSGDVKKPRRVKYLHLVVDGRDNPQYWLHLDVRADATLANLDRFLRHIWLECCGHLSAFEIGEVTYTVDYGFGDDKWGMDEESMDIKLSKAVGVGQNFYYEYDFGSTTSLHLKVVAERLGEARETIIEEMARNNEPAILCSVCGKVATNICTECIYDNTGWLCDTCAEKHECGEEMLLPVVNSPRVGVCAYAG